MLTTVYQNRQYYFFKSDSSKKNNIAVLIKTYINLTHEGDVLLGLWNKAEIVPARFEKPLRVAVLDFSIGRAIKLKCRCRQLNQGRGKQRDSFSCV